MENVFERPISVWSNTTRTANNKIEVPLRQFLDAGKDYLPTIHYLRQVYDSILQTFDSDPAASARYEEIYREGKKKLPLAAIGGTFANGGLLTDLQQPTNLLTLDIDATKPSRAAQLRAAGKEVPNEWVTDWEDVKRKLSQLPFVSYIARSVGNHGLFVIVEIKDYHRHAEAWERLEYLFKKHLKLTIDPATKDLTRPRFVSYDPQPYINETAEVFRVRKRPTTKTPVKRYDYQARNSTEEDVLECLRKIEANRIDVTGNYNDWCSIGAALHSQFGDSGEDLFVRFSQFHPEASESRSRKKYKECRTMSRISIATLFKICSDYGIRYTTPTPKPAPTPPPPPTATVEATPAPRIIYKFGESFPQPYDYMAIYDNLQLPEDFLAERQEPAPF